LQIKNQLIKIWYVNLSKDTYVISRIYLRNQMTAYTFVRNLIFFRLQGYRGSIVCKLQTHVWCIIDRTRKVLRHVCKTTATRSPQQATHLCRLTK